MDEIIARGLKIMITELDVADIDGPSDPAVRDADVASLTKRYLDVAFSKKEMLGCLTWGITNKYSWLNVYDNYKRSDGQFSRALPFDENYLPTPMFKAIEAAYRGR
jgi:endo-1,4-beta-xylanase